MTRGGGHANTIQGGAALDATMADDSPPSRESKHPLRGEQIAHFIVLDVLGTGGMGVVYAAYDANLDRKVAIKLLGSNVAESEEARLRLLREAQAMARIDHPNVLRVHEAGPFGNQIYIAMEFAGGGTLRQWLSAKQRSPHEIIEMFAQAGRGLAAAHAAGLVHRDFKPDNVLITESGPRVTDFGIVGVVGEHVPAAPADLDRSLSDTTPLSQDLTRTGALMGTPTYMAPEQFRGGLVGPGADQFAFCVALYEALYGERPFAGENYAELCANVTAGELRPAPRNGDVPPRIRKILLRGLANLSAQRYPTIDRLLAELAPTRKRSARAWLGGIAALVALGVAGVIALRPRTPAPCGGADARLSEVWSPLQQSKIEQAFIAVGRPDAKDVYAHFVPIVDRWAGGWKQGYVSACEDTRVHRVQSEHVLELRMQCLTHRLDQARATLDVLAAGGGDAVDHALEAASDLPATAPCADTAALTAAKALPSTPEARDQIAKIRADLDQARAQRKLGHYKPGLERAHAALDAARKANLAPLVPEAQLEVGMLEVLLAEPKAADTLADAMTGAIEVGDHETAVRAAASRLDKLAENPGKFGVGTELAMIAEAISANQPPSAKARVELEDATAGLLAAEGKKDEAQKQFEHALALSTSQLGPESPNTLTTLRRMGALAAARHKYDDEMKLAQQVLAAQERVVGKDHPAYASALDYVANALYNQGKVGDSKQMRERALAIRIAALGPEHPGVASSYNNLAGFYENVGDLPTAKSYFEKALALYRKAYGDDAFELASTASNLGDVLNEMGDRAGARKLLEQARALYEKAYTPDDPRVAPQLAKLGVLARDEKRLDDALALFQRAEDLVTKGFGPNDPEAVDYLGEMATTYTHMNKLPEARETMSRTVSAVSTVYGPKHPRMAAALGNYGFLQIKLKDYEGAFDSFDKARAILESTVGKKHPYVAFTQIGAAQALIELKRHKEAVPRLEQALEIGTAAHIAPAQIAEMHYYLALALSVDPKQRARARTEANAAITGYKAIPKHEHDAKDAENLLKKI